MKNLKKIFLKIYKKDDYNKIKKTKIFIIGCGGLGSNIAEILLRSGFENLIIADFDKVKLKNLNRQRFLLKDVGKHKVKAIKKFLKKINPDVNIKIYKKKIDEKFFKKIIEKEKVNIIVEAVDDEKVKKMIFEKSLLFNKKVVCASGIAGFGDCENIKIKRGKNFSIVGDMQKSVKKFKPLCPKVMAVAAVQADEVLRMVLKNE